MKNIAINQDWEPENLNNDDIENCVLQLEAEHTQQNVMELISTLKRSVNDQKMLFIPVMEEYETKTGGSLFDTEKLNIAKLMEPVNPNGIPRKVELIGGGMAFTAFTSRKELDKGQPTKFTAAHMKDFFEMALEDMNITGIVINPWDVSVLLDKRLLTMILAEDGKVNHKGNLFVDLGDIRTAKTDAMVVNVTTNLEPISLLSQKIFQEGGEKLKESLSRKESCPIGEAVIARTDQKNTKFLILTTPPIFSGAQEEIEQLMACYINALNLAASFNLRSIAFSVSDKDNGGFPEEEAAKIAVMSCSRWIVDHPDYEIAIDLVCDEEKTQQTFLEFVKSKDPEEK